MLVVLVLPSFFLLEVNAVEDALTLLDLTELEVAGVALVVLRMLDDLVFSSLLLVEAMTVDFSPLLVVLEVFLSSSFLVLVAAVVEERWADEVTLNLVLDFLFSPFFVDDD